MIQRATRLGDIQPLTIWVKRIRHGTPQNIAGPTKGLRSAALKAKQKKALLIFIMLGNATPTQEIRANARELLHLADSHENDGNFGTVASV